jgi:hypothetical protein
LGQKLCIQGFGGDVRGVHRKITRRFRIILIWILEKLYGNLGWIDLADPCGRGDETSRFIKCGGFLDWLTNCSDSQERAAE